MKSLPFGAVLVVTMAASTFSLAAFAVLAADLISEFAVSREQIGYLVTASALVGAASAPILGPWSDRIGARRGTIFSLFVSFVGLAALTLAPTFGLLVIAALGTGVTQGIANPATNKLISLHVPPGRRGIITGIKQSGVQAGTAFGGILLPAMAAWFGWRSGVAAMAALAALGLILAMSVVPPDVGAAQAVQGGPGFEGGDIGRLTAYGFLLGAGGTAIFTYVPLFAQEALGLSPLVAGSAVTVMGVVGVIARIIWGRVTEVWLGADLSLAVIAVLAAAGGMLLVAGPGIGSWSIWPAAILTGLSASAWNTVGMLAVIDRVPVELAGRASGRVMFGFLAGLGIGAPLLGRSVDATGDYVLGWGVTTLVFLGALAVMVPTLRRQEPESAGSRLR
ncbi:MAG: MFS transporter [Acidimicrobiia bacterium]|nr:MFS transporter [Acidimicrobiia bacterium]MDH4307779.1 MFS transporter [Acidimicrobiia bacterium]MDH5292539.1 MFS transporter [Acidimicrobiia bacterium]